MSDTTAAAPATHGPFGRLVRSLSHKRTQSKDKPNATVAPVAVVEPLQEEPEPVAVLETPSAAADAAPAAAVLEIPSAAADAAPAAVVDSVTADPEVLGEPAPSKPALFAVDRFKALIGVKKATTASFPPRAWQSTPVEEEVPVEGSPAGASNPVIPSLPPTPGTEKIADELSIQFEHEIQGKRREPSADCDEDDVPEPYTFAQKIQSLINSLPPAAGGSTLSPKPPIKDANGKPIPPPPPPVTNAALCKLLSSASVMNGSITRGRQSVWDVLDHLNVKLPHNHSPSEGTEEGDDEDDNSAGIMMYAPLLPLPDSTVTVANSEMVAVGENGIAQSAEEKLLELRGKDPREAASHDKKSFWPFGRKKPVEKVEEVLVVDGQPGCKPEPHPKKGKGKGPAKLPKQVRVWVPSVTQISAQATWWGYRIYLPPPVLDILSNKTIEATKRAAMITTALTWMVNNIPTTMIPPQLKPVAMLLKRLAPYLGYIGTFIAWSWQTVKSYDTGHGVIMTATWLLPVALLPATWEAADVPKPAPVEDPKEAPKDEDCNPAPPCEAPKAPSSSTPAVPAPVVTEPAPVVVEPTPVVPVVAAPPAATEPIAAPVATEPTKSEIVEEHKPAVDDKPIVEPAVKENPATKKKYGFFGY